MKSFSVLAHSVSNLEDLRNVPCKITRKYNGYGFIYDGGITYGMPLSEIPWAKSSSGYSTGLWTLGRTGEAHCATAPDTFLARLPKVPVQGELWINDSLSDIGSVVRATKYPDPRAWALVTPIVYNVKPYCCWDLPPKLNMQSSKFYANVPYRERLKQIEDNIDLTKAALPLGGISENAQEFDILWAQMHADFLANNWEGLMIAKLSSPYECSRSYSMLKYLPDYDIEGTVVGYTAGEKSRVTGKMSGLSVELTWDEKVLSFHGGKPHMVGQKAKTTVGGLNHYEMENISTAYPINSEVRFTFKSITDLGNPLSANMYRGK